MSGKAAQNTTQQTAQTSDTTPKFTPSKMVSDALGDHAEQQGLTQAESESEIEFAVRCITVLGDQIEARKKANEALQRELTDIKRSLAAQKGATTRKINEIEAMEEAAKPRAFGPIKKPLAASELWDLIDEPSAAEIVLAFSNGDTEVRGIAPRKVSADAFRLTRGRLFFNSDALTITGPGGDDVPAAQVAGIALVLDGDQVAWCEFPKPLSLGAGQTISLAGSVIFG